jgi:signal peptide peptidase SppA
MRSNNLLAVILGAPFMMQHQAVLGYLPQVAMLMRGEGVQQQGLLAKRRVRAIMVAEYGQPGAASVAATKRVKGYDDAPQGSVAVHTLKGVMLKDDQVGLCQDVPGTASLGRALQAADAHENIVAHVVRIDSGGGSVDGTAELGAIAKGLSKPIVAYSDGIIASAAYWFASSCSKILLNNSTCAVGSIGVMCSVADYKPMLEKLGVVFHDLRADDSDEKNEDFRQLIEGNHKPYIENVLNPLRDMFANTVKANRPQLATKESDKLLRGNMYFADSAVAEGLADEIGNFSRAVALALELAEAGDTSTAGEASGNSATSSNQPNMSLFAKNKFPAVAALAGLTGAAMTADLVTAANTELEAAGITGAALISEAAHDALEADATAWNAAYTALEAAGATDVAALAADRDKYKAEAAAFGNQPGVLPTSSTKEKPDSDEEGGDENAKLVEALHEKMLNGN